jgi:hypothetical protein
VGAGTWGWGPGEFLEKRTGGRPSRGVARGGRADQTGRVQAGSAICVATEYMQCSSRGQELVLSAHMHTHILFMCIYVTCAQHICNYAAPHDHVDDEAEGGRALADAAKVPAHVCARTCVCVCVRACVCVCVCKCALEEGGRVCRYRGRVAGMKQGVNLLDPTVQDSAMSGC